MVAEQLEVLPVLRHPPSGPSILSDCQGAVARYVAARCSMAWRAGSVDGPLAVGLGHTDVEGGDCIAARAHNRGKRADICLCARGDD